MPALLILYFCARTYDRDYVRYSDIMKVKRKAYRYYILAYNDKGKKYWYSMVTPLPIQPFMQWVDQNYFPHEER